jgi:hypothetical protein
MTNIYHDLAKLKGFHDNDEFDEQGKPTPRQLLAWAALICSEWFEWRAENHPWYKSEEFHNFGKPEGMLAELADVCIRCYDAAGAMGQELPDMCKAAGDHMVWHALCLKLIEVARMGDVKAYCFTLTDMTSFCLSKSSMIVEEYDDDDMPKTIEEAMARKHAYNKTRPHRHGKKA